MDSALYIVRPFRPGDYDREAAVHGRIAPERTFTAEGIRHFDERVFVPPLTNVKLVAEHRSSGEPVGFGYLHSDVESVDPRNLWVDVVVDPNHQGRGIGRALATAIGLEAERRNAERLWTAARVADARAVSFLGHQGFLERARSWRSCLDLRRAAELPDRSAELSREGFSFTNLAQEDLEDPRLLQEVYAVTVAVSEDEPRLGAYTPITFEQFVERDLHGPGFLRDGFFLARRGGTFVGLSAVWRADGAPETLQQAFTGTRREVRGKGVATELKRRVVAYGRAHGYRYIRTGNDSRNLPMLAINRKLGFQPEAVRILAEKKLGGGSGRLP